MNDPRLAFFAYAYNLAEVTRAIEVAKALCARGVEIHFFTHGGAHEHRMNEAGFALATLAPSISPEKSAYFMNSDQGRAFGQPFSVAEWTALGESELAALRQFQPAAVYGGDEPVLDDIRPRRQTPAYLSAPHPRHDPLLPARSGQLPRPRSTP